MFFKLQYEGLVKELRSWKYTWWFSLFTVKRELEAEAAALAEKQNAATAEVCITVTCSIISASKWLLVFIGNTCWFNSFQGTNVLVQDLACLSVSGVYFTCPLTGATLTKSKREVHIKEAILMVRLKMFCFELERVCNSQQHNPLIWMSVLITHVLPCYCQRFEEDAVEASVMMMHTFNKDREKVKTAVDIISK